MKFGELKNTIMAIILIQSIVGILFFKWIGKVPGVNTYSLILSIILLIVFSSAIATIVYFLAS
ncbi:hypothetical protein AKJ40_02575 [candidate division MSBL1 archaeon SCGC-AAA259M10]|uniref:Uncharacterized protein n=4 Tax=candidate division MSBL1 TaxID=215777 RepID=A0A133UPR6_9EURY|nr:hypothetical protein AKJ61_02780 [candidate division MSBL1 archaeon SCGC-AAA259B11]KXA93652.1 hypothetical protein AKJ66_01465 [candidate division MSBL1 archaeon SCGC-AAA259E22]KXA96185.1 hypothetical protein AKJ38_03745 [candidate division MSBL1 archaeon SCGC-AAA259I14]KXA99702.1 hypothetical protein AKJ40_02575 [candidate division MSBL1 archaeon SCGC-AAA259M10]